MIVGSLAAVPAALFLTPPPEAVEYLINAAGVVFGVGLLQAPWERLTDRALYVVSVVASAYVTIATALYSDDFAFYQVLIAVYAAYVVPRRRDFFLLMAMFTVLTIAPTMYADGSFDSRAHHILVTLPVLLISAAVVRYLRDTLSQREQEYRRFAAEAVALAERIRGGSGEPPGATDETERRLAELALKTRP
jgi:hypothetical protein